MHVGQKRQDALAGHAGPMTAALVLTGAPGAGKTSVLEALTTLLEIDGIAYGALETEQLGWGSPWLADELRLRQLAAVVTLQRQAGREVFLLAATTETTEQLHAFIRSVDVDRVLVILLCAAPDVVASRVARREPDAWPGKPALIAHARDLALSMSTIDGVDIVIETDQRDHVEVAEEVRRVLVDHGLLDSA